MTNSQSVPISRRFLPCIRAKREIPPREAIAGTTPCIFNWSPIVGHSLVSIHRSRVPTSVRRARRPLVFFPWLKNQPRVKYIQDSRRRIFNGEIFQHDLRRVGRIYTCVWVRARRELLALAGAGDAKNPRAKRNGKIHQTALTHLTPRVSLHITSTFRLLYFFLFWRIFPRNVHWAYRD